MTEPQPDRGAEQTISDKAIDLLDWKDTVTDFAVDEAIHSAICDVADGEVTDLAAFFDAIKTHAQKMLERETMTEAETLPLIRAANEQWHTWARTLKGRTDG